MTRIGSLFSGSGMLDEGVRTVLGGDVAWHAEIDPAASKVLEYRYPNVPNLGDVSAVDWASVEPVDVLTGGYPCQPFSHAGRRMGTDDPRHLWPHVADAVAVMRPPWLFFENVRGHLSLGFDIVLRDIDLLGYDCQWVVLKASDIGAPHGRARIFILGRDRERRLRCGPSGRRGVHRDRPREWVSEPAPQGCDDGQGAAVAASHGADVWRLDQFRADTERSQSPGRALLAGQRQVGGRDVEETRAASVGEGRDSAGGAGVRCNGERREAVEAARDSLDGRDAQEGERLQAANPRTEPSRSRPGAASAAGGYVALGDLPMGCLVGAGREPVRSSGVRGIVADIGLHDRRTCVLTTDGAAATAGLFTPADADAAGPQGREPARRRDLSDRCAPADAGSTARPGLLAGDTEPGDCGASPLREGHAGSRGLNRVASDTDRDGLQGVGRVIDLGRDTDGRGSADIAWGQYEPAIRRWETVLGRRAPAPTERGPKGGQRLSPRLTEWLMGWPDGWVTDVPGVSRNDALKLCGNGVVALQAAEALRRMLGAGEVAAASELSSLLLPTPAAMNPNDGESLESWEARRQRVKLTAKNGNGFGTPLAIAVQQINPGGAA